MKLKKQIDTMLAYLLIILTYLGCILSLNVNPFSNYLPRHDSSMFMYFGKGMSEGLVPYVDMFDHKGIVLFWIQHLGITIGGGNDTLGIWLTECLFLLVTYYFFIKTVRLFSNNNLVAALPLMLISWVFITAAQGGNFSETYSLSFISIALFLFSKYILKNNLKPYEFILIGVTGALTFFTRPNMIALWLVICIYILMSLLITKAYKALACYAGQIFIGGILVCLVILIYGLLMGNLREMIYQTIILNLQYSAGNSLLNKIESISLFVQFMNDNYLLLFLSLSLLLFASLKKHITDQEIRLFFLTLIYAVINFATVIVSGRFYPHYFITMLPAFLLLFSLALSWVNRQPNFQNLSLIAIVLLIFTLHVQMVNGFNNVVKLNTAKVNQYQESIEVKISDYIKKHTTTDDNIYVHALSANIYLQSNRFSNSKFFVLPSLDYTQFPTLQKEFKQDFSENPPQFIVVSKGVYESENLDNRRMNQFVLHLIESKYKPVSEFQTSDQLLFQKK